jgi:hypothetical protein
MKTVQVLIVALAFLGCGREDDPLEYYEMPSDAINSSNESKSASVELNAENGYSWKHPDLLALEAAAEAGEEKTEPSPIDLRALFLELRDETDMETILEAMPKPDMEIHGRHLSTRNHTLTCVWERDYAEREELTFRFHGGKLWDSEYTVFREDEE